MFHIYLTVFIQIIAALLCSFEVCWGFLEPYFSSYLKYEDQSLTTREIHTLYSTTQYGDMLSALCFRPVQLYLGHREGLLICFILQSVGYFIISATSSLNVMKISMLMFGYAINAKGYHGHYLLMELFPGKPGTVAGMANVGGPMAIFFLGTLAANMINPSNLKQTIVVQEGANEVMYFNSTVTDKFSACWLYLGLFTIFTGILLIPIMKNSKA